MCPRAMMQAPTIADIEEAQRRLRAYLQPTPLVESPELGRDVLLKLETLQPTGSFKVRGAFAALIRLPTGSRVVTASAGNHGLGVAYAAARLGLEATVVCAETASPAKLSALRRLPVELVIHGAGYDDAERHALTLAEEGREYVSAYNDPAVIAGAGTLALELLAEPHRPLDLVCPVGGGGLVSGVGLASSAESDVRVIGVEADASRALSAAVAAGSVVTVDIEPTLADGLAGNLEQGSITVALAARHVTSFAAVTEQEIAAAIRFLHREHGLVVEGAGAAAVAAVLSGRHEPRARTICIVSGRNIDEQSLARVLGTE